MDIPPSSPSEKQPQKAGFEFAAKRWLVTFLTCVGAICATIAMHESGNFDPYLTDRRAFGTEFWRFFMGSLAHVDALHLIFNVVAVSTLGYAVETRIGHSPTLLLILVLAIVSGAAQYAWDAVGIGLSGVAYGLFGLLCVQTHMKKRWLRAIDWRLTLPLVVWGLACLQLDRLGFDVGNVAHGAGFFAGALIAFPMGMESRQRRLASIPAISFCVLSLVAGALRARDDAENEGAFNSLVRAYEALMRSDLDAARAEASAALLSEGLAPEQRADALTYRASANSSAGRLEQAGTDYLAAFELVPLRKDLRDNLRWWLSTQSTMDDAALDRSIDAFRRRDRAKTIAAPEAFAAGLLYRLKGERESARELFQKAVELEPHVSKYREALEHVDAPAK